MILKPALAAMLASGLIVPEAPKFILPKPAIVKAENLEFSKHMLLGMPLTMGMLGPFGLGPGPWEVNYIGGAETANNASTSLTGTFNLGPAYSDRICYVVCGSSTTGSGTTGVTVGGVSGTTLITRLTYGAMEIWKVIDFPGTDAVTVTATCSSRALTFYVYICTGALLGKNTVVDTRTAGANNTNSISVSFATTAVGDMFVAGGQKVGGGATSYAGFGGTAGVAEDANRSIGLSAGSMSGGHSSPLATSGSKTITSSASDSSKSVELIAIKISKG